MDEDEGELTFVPSAVSSSARWHEPSFKRDRRCEEEGFIMWDCAAEMVEENGELFAMNLCKDTRVERSVPKLNSWPWRRPDGENMLQGRLALRFGFLGLNHKTMEIYAEKVYAKNLLEVAAAALSGAQDYLNESPHMKLALFQGSENMMLPKRRCRKRPKRKRSEPMRSGTRSLDDAEVEEQLLPSEAGS